MLDSAIMRGADVAMSFPTILVAISIMAVLGQGVGNIMIALTLIHIPRVARVVRSTALEIRDREFVQAVRGAGASDVRIVTHHVGPHCFAPWLIQLTLTFVDAVRTEATLSFVGLGTPPPPDRTVQCLVVDRAVEALRGILENEPEIAYALLFGSGAREALRPDSDVDVAVALSPDAARDTRTLGRLAARLESTVGRRVDLVLIDEAPSPLAYRIFRDGRLILERDHDALVARKARAILDYLDFKPVETRCAEGVLRAAAGRG